MGENIRRGEGEQTRGAGVLRKPIPLNSYDNLGIRKKIRRRSKGVRGCNFLTSLEQF